MQKTRICVGTDGVISYLQSDFNFKMLNTEKASSKKGTILISHRPATPHSLTPLLDSHKVRAN